MVPADSSWLPSTSSSSLYKVGDKVGEPGWRSDPLDDFDDFNLGMLDIDLGDDAPSPVVGGKSKPTAAPSEVVVIRRVVTVVFALPRSWITTGGDTPSAVRSALSSSKSSGLLGVLNEGSLARGEKRFCDRAHRSSSATQTL